MAAAVEPGPRAQRRNPGNRLINPAVRAKFPGREKSAAKPRVSNPMNHGAGTGAAIFGNYLKLFWRFTVLTSIEAYAYHSEH
jgi:hypothetical protein